MTCLKVRDRLAEFALGVLPALEAREVERHLAWCTGCRKEASELQQGLEVVAQALPPADPPVTLESRIVHRVAVGKDAPARRRSRRALLSLAAATLAAMLVAGGAVGWAVAERDRAETLQETTAKQRGQIDAFKRVLQSFPQGGLRSQAVLRPVLAGEGSGQVLISTDPLDVDWILVSVAVQSPSEATYTVEATDRDGRAISGGPLNAQSPGSFLFWEKTGKDLSKAAWVTVYGPSGQAVLAGQVLPSSESPSATG